MLCYSNTNIHTPTEYYIPFATLEELQPAPDEVFFFIFYFFKLFGADPIFYHKA